MKEQYQSPCDGWGRDDINSSASGGVSPEAEFSIFTGKRDECSSNLWIAQNCIAMG